MPSTCVVSTSPGWRARRAAPVLASDLSDLSDDADLYQCGMTSHASVNVMLALEGAFDIEFPDHMLKRSVFTSIASIRGALLELDAVRTPQ